VDVDKGAYKKSEVEGQFSEYAQGETHMPIVVEEPNLEVLGNTAAALGTESNALYTYEQVASVFEADDDRVSSPAVDTMVSKAIDYRIGYGHGLQAMVH
jgi:hypothetical protein